MIAEEPTDAERELLRAWGYRAVGRFASELIDAWWVDTSDGIPRHWTVALKQIARDEARGDKP